MFAFVLNKKRKENKQRGKWKITIITNRYVQRTNSFFTKLIGRLVPIYRVSFTMGKLPMVIKSKNNIHLITLNFCTDVDENRWFSFMHLTSGHLDLKNEMRIWLSSLRDIHCTCSKMSKTSLFMCNNINIAYEMVCVHATIW